MSRDAELERILQAWFDWESCSAAAKNQYRDAFHRLLARLFHRSFKF